MLEDKDYQETEQVIDQRNKQFGDYALSINNPGEFIRRISIELNSKKYLWKADNIEYVDIDSVDDNYNLFKKPFSYNYQNEYRFLIKSWESEPIKLYLGSLQDIATVLSTDEICSIKLIDSDD
jgi:hypothetical protein